MPRHGRNVPGFLHTSSSRRNKNHQYLRFWRTAVGYSFRPRMIDRFVAASVTWNPRQSYRPPGVSVQARHFAVAKLPYSHRRRGSSRARYIAPHTPLILVTKQRQNGKCRRVRPRRETARLCKRDFRQGIENTFFGLHSGIS